MPSLFHEAVKKDDIKFVSEHLSVHPDEVDLLDEHGNTPLIYACKAGNMEMVKLLLAYEANPNKTSTRSSILVDHVADDEDEFYCDQLGTDLGNYVSTRPPDLITVHGLGITPLYAAIESGHLEVVRLLVENGADPNQAMGFFDNALDRAKDPLFKDLIIKPEIIAYLEELDTAWKSKDSLRNRLQEIATALPALPMDVTSVVQEYESSAIDTMQTAFRNFITKPRIIIHVVASRTQLLGDRHHALGLQRALASSYIHAPEIREWDPGVAEEFSSFLKMLQRVEGGPKHIVIGVGTVGLQYLPKLKEDPNLKNHVITVWSGHQFVSELTDKTGQLDIMGLPEHETALIKHPRLISAYGVPHDATPEVMLEKFQQYKKEFIEGRGHAVVILGGDAPDAAGKIKKFTPDCAGSLGITIASNVQANSKDAIMIVTTGPRTSPECIAAFRGGVIEKGIPADRIKILEFSSFKGASMAALHFLKHFPHPDHRLFVTADSITMATAAMETQKQGIVTLVETDSMSEGHWRFFERCRELGLVHCLKKSELLSSHLIWPVRTIQYKQKEYFPTVPHKVEALLGAELRTRVDQVLGLIPTESVKASRPDARTAQRFI